MIEDQDLVAEEEDKIVDHHREEIVEITKETQEDQDQTEDPNPTKNLDLIEDPDLIKEDQDLIKENQSTDLNQEDLKKLALKRVSVRVEVELVAKPKIDLIPFLFLISYFLFPIFSPQNFFPYYLLGY